MDYLNTCQWKPSLKLMLPLSGQLLNYKSNLGSLGLSVLGEFLGFLWRNFQCVDLIREYIYKFYSGQNYFERKQTVGELCDRINIGWTSCTLCCEVNTGNKRILIQQKIETLDLFYKQFISRVH